MLKPKVFLDLVEIQTKIASLFPFIIGLLFSYFYYGSLNPKVSAVFFASMLIFDMTTTGINNLMDYIKSNDDNYKKKHNIIGIAGLSTKAVAVLLICMLLVATGLGLWLVYLTDIFVLLVGIVCFFIGIFYTYGPLPLSRLPLGEVFSGVTMGLGILFLVVYINVHHLGFVSVYINQGFLDIHINLVEIATIVLVSTPTIFTISNIMLANNICDLEQDIKNNRYTLPYFLGKKTAIRVFEISYMAAYVSIVVAVFFGVYDLHMLLVLCTLVPVTKNLKLFRKEQIKSQTFVVSIKNMLVINGSIVVGFVASILL